MYKVGVDLGGTNIVAAVVNEKFLTLIVKLKEGVLIFGFLGLGLGGSGVGNLG